MTHAVRSLLSLMLLLAAGATAAAQPYEYPGGYASRFDGIDTAPKPQLKAQPGAGAKAKPKAAPQGATKQLKANQPVVPCDCSNCSAPHCGPDTPAWHEGVMAGSSR